ncbi:aKG-HExxH-type peptide beta-hydroxylase [Streptomyces sp. NPDC058308]|uniref:aKG-HExxH-type peptide beta-hydroxylase n=1 Tax=Streptomyces sp. NPDC058308 TaxID=3346440 RepID=UPI0036E6D8F9
MVCSVLTAAGLPAPPEAHPAVVAAAFTLQAEPGLTPSAILRSTRDTKARESLAPAEPSPHLIRSVTRALSALPTGADAPGGSRVVSWQRPDRAVLDESVARLAAAWPLMLSELRIGVAQVALLEGPAIDGFTDFATHGAIYVNRSRLRTSPRGLPGPVRCAEALVHEGTHTRCNAAQLSTPFLTTAADSARPVRTPLRADPRPVAGLFQQMVVLARSSALYALLLGGDTTAADALEARRVLLAERARQAIGSLRDRAPLLTGHGLTVLEECAALLRTTAV